MISLFTSHMIITVNKDVPETTLIFIYLHCGIVQSTVFKFYHTLLIPGITPGIICLFVTHRRCTDPFCKLFIKGINLCYNDIMADKLLNLTMFRVH